MVGCPDGTQREPPSSAGALTLAPPGYGVGVLLSGVRDLYATCGLPYGAWPWGYAARGPRRPARMARRRFHRVVFALAVLIIRRGECTPCSTRNGSFALPACRSRITHSFCVSGHGHWSSYGILYLEVARRPEHGWLLAAIGLLGKILGPVGLARLIWSGQWPWSTAVLCLTNDVIWWLPFALYLYDAWPAFIQHCDPLGSPQATSSLRRYETQTVLY